MQPRDFSDFADQLNLQQGLHCEALYRTATGRWYYSLYNEVKSWLENRFADVWKNTPGSSHENLVTVVTNYRELILTWILVNLVEIWNQ